MQQDLWKDACEFHVSDRGGILQLVGLDSPTHTLFGRIHHDAKLPEQTYSVQQVLKYMLHQVQVDLQETLKLLATDLLRLGAVWKLSAPNDGGTNNKLKRQRQFLENATDSLQSNIESLRVHFLPTRFPAAYTVDWTLPLPRQSTVHTKNRFAILDWNLNHGYAVIDKPYGLASHETVDNGVENALYRVQQQLREAKCLEKASLPQRLDIETEGLLLVALKPEFASYIGRLLQQKSLSSDTCGIYKQCKCLVHLSSKEQREELVCKLSTDDMGQGLLVEHYMDPKSVAPTTFQLNPCEGWLKCALRVLDIGPVMKCIVNDDETGVDDEQQLLVQVRVTLLMGWTHQIRGQFAAMSMPLVGDPLYGRQSCKCNREWDAKRSRGDALLGETERLGLQCCLSSFLKPKWEFHAKKNRNMLVPDESGEYCTYRRQEGWWSDRLVQVD
jgi:23S rRNA-/tRNA-specific pseudouridylate synthase